MNQATFKWEQSGVFRYLAFKPWSLQGFKHGFIGSSADFADKALQEHATKFCSALQVRRLCLLNQVHGSGFLIADPQCIAKEPDSQTLIILGQADALLIPNVASQTGPFAFGIRTADCLPILFRSDIYLGLIHAGWRGLACGLLQAVGKFLYSEGVKEIELAIGPAAKQECYQVGEEVIQALGPGAVVEEEPCSRPDKEPRSRPEKVRLSLSGTAKRAINNSWPGRVVIHDSEICTICRPDFHSYRRLGPGTGSNMTFFVA